MSLFLSPVFTCKMKQVTRLKYDSRYIEVEFKKKIKYIFLEFIFYVIIFILKKNSIDTSIHNIKQFNIYINILYFNSAIMK